MMAVQTFGVDADHIAAFEPQITVSNDGPVTSARLTIIINASAARINGLMSFHGIDPADVAATTTSVEYANAKRLITDRVRVDLQQAAYGSTSVAAETAIYDERANAEIAAWRAAPDTLGADVTNDVSPGVFTSTDNLNLDTQDKSQRRRRRYDRARDRTAGLDDGHRW
jgi:hypothetical protein